MKWLAILLSTAMAVGCGGTKKGGTTPEGGTSTDQETTAGGETGTTSSPTGDPVPSDKEEAPSVPPAP